MANTKTADVLLRWQVDSASVNRVRASFTNLENELSDLQAELTGVGTAAQQGVNGLRNRFAAGEQSVESMQNEVEQLRAELLALDDVNVTPTINVQQSGGGQSELVGGLNTIDQIGRIGTQIGGGLGAGALGNAVNLIGDVAGAAATLNPVLIAATAAIGAVSLVTVELTKAYEEAKTAAKEYLAAQSQINALVLQGDTEELQAKRDQLRNEIAARNQTSASLTALLTRFDELQTGADAILAGQEDLNTTGLNYAEILAEQEKLIDQISVETNGAITNVGVLRDSVASFDEETAGLEADLALAENGLSRAREADRQRAAAANQLADGLQYINQQWGPFLKGVVDLGVGLYNLATGVSNLKAATDAFTGGLAGAAPVNTKSVKAAEEAAAAALQKDQSDAYLTAITNTVKAQEELTKAQNAYNEAVAASQLRIAEIGRKLQEDLAAAETDRQRDLADAARQAGEERVKATEDAEKERTRIQRRFDRAYADAVGDRDALAAKRAEDQKADELRDLDERYKDQLKTVDKNLAAQQRIIEARYQQQVATLNAAAQAAVRTEQQAAAARLAALQQGVQAAQVALINAQQAEYLIRANFYNQAVSQAQVWANLMQLYTAYGFSIPGGTTTKQPINIGGKASGGPVMASTPYVVGEKGPEVFVPTQPGRIIPNGAGMTINLQGATLDTIRVVSRQQALAAFGRVLDTMGVA